MDTSEELKKVFVVLTPRQWETVEKRLAALGKKNLSSYVMGRILLLEKQYQQDKGICEIRPTKEKPIHIDEKHHKVLEKISIRSGKPVATVLTRLILEPLMMPLD